MPSHLPRPSFSSLPLVVGVLVQEEDRQDPAMWLKPVVAEVRQDRLCRWSSRWGITPR